MEHKDNLIMDNVAHISLLVIRQHKLQIAFGIILMNETSTKTASIMLHNPESEEISDLLIIFKKRFVFEKFKPIKKNQKRTTTHFFNAIQKSYVCF